MPYQNWLDPQVAQSFDSHHLRSNPSRATQLDILVNILQDHLKQGWILDIGMGSGLVEEMIFQHIPGAQVVGVDVSPAMLALAKKRLHTHIKAGQIELLEHDLAALESLSLPDVPFAAAISVQTLHHLSQSKMQQVYQFIHHTLTESGLFLLLDRMQITTPKLYSVFRSVWHRQDKRHDSIILQREGETFSEHVQITRHRGDFPLPPEQHLSMLRQAGFEAAILHLHGNRALIAGRK